MAPLSEVLYLLDVLIAILSKQRSLLRRVYGTTFYIHEIVASTVAAHLENSLVLRQLPRFQFCTQKRRAPGVVSGSRAPRHT